MSVNISLTSQVLAQIALWNTSYLFGVYKLPKKTCNEEATHLEKLVGKLTKLNI